MSGESIVPPDLYDSQKSPKRILAWLTGGLTLLQALFAFVLSFSALTNLATKHQFSIPPLFPLVVEAGVVIFSLNALYRSIHGESTRWQWCLIIGSSVLAGMFNVIHAEADLVSRVMAAMPSLFLLLAFETFLGQIKYGVVWSQVAQNLQHLLTRTQAVQTEIEQQQAEVEQLTAQIDDLKATKAKIRSELAKLEVQARSATAFNKVTLTHANAARQTNKQQALNDLLAFYSEHPTASMNEAGQAIGRAKSTVSNYLNELEQIGRLRRNGDGVEVLD